MITPAYAPTATERVLPRLALDFTTGVLDPRVTVTRALNTATRVNSSGVIETVNANLPRFDYDSVTLAPKGLLIEETRTNLCVYSQSGSDGNWAVLGGAKTSTNNTDPFGTNTAILYTADGASSAHYLAWATVVNVSYTSGTSYTTSVFVKAGSLQRVQMTFPSAVAGSGQYANFLLTGAGSVTASNGGTAAIQALKNGWYRISWTVTATASVSVAGGVLYFISSDTDTRAPINTVSGTVYAIGCQTEAGAFATSYIPTTTTSLTRNADVVSMTGANFSSWYNASEGAFAAQFFSFGSSTGAVMQAGIGNNLNERVAWYTTASNFVISNSTGVNQAALGNSSLINVAAKVCGTYKVDSFAAAINGGTVATDNIGTVAAPNALSIGHRNTASPNLFLNGWVQKLNYWPQRFTNAEVQAFSK